MKPSECIENLGYVTEDAFIYGFSWVGGILNAFLLLPIYIGVLSLEALYGYAVDNLPLRVSLGRHGRSEVRSQRTGDEPV